MEDSHGNIWFSGDVPSADVLDRGESPKPGASVLNRFDPAAGLENMVAARERFEVEEEGMIFGLTEDADGNIWFGTGRGIARIHGHAVQHY